METSTLTNETLWTKFDEHLENEGLTRQRRNKLRTMFGIVARGLEVPLAQAHRPELEAFIGKLHKDTLLKATKRGKKPVPLSSSTKSDLKKFLKQFYKWLRGNNEFYPPEVAWIKAKIPKDQQPAEKEVLSIKDVEHLAAHFKHPEYKLLTLLLFDSGFRINEILSAKKNDLTWEEYDGDQKCFWIACRQSKTETRKIPVPLFTDELRLFFNGAYYAGLSESDSLFTVNYEAYLKQLKAVGLKLFQKKLTPHALRHSSATYYALAFDGDMTLIANRFGWKYNSKELATYIRKSGAYQRRQAKKVFTNDVIKLADENKALREYIEQIEERLNQTTSKFTEEMTHAIRAQDEYKKAQKQYEELIEKIKSR